MRDSDLNPGLGEVGRQLWDLLKAASGEGSESSSTPRRQPERRAQAQAGRPTIIQTAPQQARSIAEEPDPVVRRTSASRQRQEIRRMLHDRGSLRRAILLSEILGPPKSLRRDES